MVKSRRQRRNRSKSRSRKHRGGGSCSARPLNRQLFGWNRQQRGGMAPLNSIGEQFLSGADRTIAGVAGQDEAFATSQVLAKQAAGRRRSRRSRRSQHSRRRSQQSRHRSQQSRHQRGGDLQDFKASYDLGFLNNTASIRAEQTVNPSVGFHGAQA